MIEKCIFFFPIFHLNKMNTEKLHSHKLVDEDGRCLLQRCHSLLYNVSLNPTVICWSPMGRDPLISWISWFLDNLNSFTLVESNELKPPDWQRVGCLLATHVISASLLPSALSTCLYLAPSMVWVRPPSLQSRQLGRAWRVNEWKRRAGMASSQGAQFEKRIMGGWQWRIWFSLTIPAQHFPLESLCMHSAQRCTKP